MKEKDFQKIVLEDLRTAGWLACHFGNSVKLVRRGDTYIPVPDKDARGFPDVIGLKGSRGLALELKGKRTPVRPEQLVWIAAFREAGFEAHIVRPTDWPEIASRL